MGRGEESVEENRKIKTNYIDERRLSVIVFALFFSWLLAFPFEGQILYSLADYYHISTGNLVFGLIAVHFIGLFACGFFIKNLLQAKRLILFSIVCCIAASAVFFLPPTFLWTAALLAAALLASASVAAWGFFFKNGTAKNQRIKTAADGLIFSNLIMILLNMAAIHISPQLGLSLSMLMLGAAFIFALRLPEAATIADSASPEHTENPVSIVKPLAFLCLFIVVITINSGLMYQVQGPAFADLEWLTSWYWAVPYIVALIIMRNLPRKANRTYILYVAIAMIGFSFIAFTSLDRSASSYFIVNTLMLGACGVYDLFWWSILGEMLDLHKNSARVLGFGLSANVFGVLLGGLIGKSISFANLQSFDSTLLALGVVCLTLALLPPLHKHLSVLLKDHAYLTIFSEKPIHQQKQMMEDFSISGDLTERESEIAVLLLTGKTYRMIAGELNISENTVKTHVKNIYSKAGVHNRTELMNILLHIHPPAMEYTKTL